MHERLMKAAEGGDIEVIDTWEEGDVAAVNCVKRKASKVFMELLSDTRVS